ncbi:adhesion G-protein coupled receptor G5-like [Megalobrama amblycephala]|uniref:adhesion G-protein coupled receptor G5-like n=1 Tax=Megalobrama amblycephala TaxID=75352 RepID=UPI0020146FEC|nr:adhesion G-protein coupled receptor G5-like [Megalobrama amblycephala]
MKLLLLLIMIYGVDGQIRRDSIQTQISDTTSQKKELTPMTNTAFNAWCKKEMGDFLKTDCVYTAFNGWCKKEIDDFLNADCSLLTLATWRFKTLCLGGQQEALEKITKKEKECIHSILKTTKESKTYHFADFALTVILMNKQTNKADNCVPITAPSVSKKTQTIQTMIPVEPFQNVPEDQQKVGVVTYDSNMQFNMNNSIMSQVIRIEVPGRDTVKLNSTNPLIIHFPVNNYTNHTNTSYIYSCQYYDEHGNNTWKTDGCNTTQLSDNLVECSCNHMTPFAVLLVEVINIDERQWEILSYISYVGCGLSAIFSACSVLSFIFNRNSRAEVSNRIHVSLSGALFLLNISFMLSEWAATLSAKEFCVFIAVMIHYSLLSCFTWMAVEALHLYLLLIRVFNIYVKYYMTKLSLIGWGIPAVVIGSLLSIHITRPIYGTKDVTLANSNATNAVCWITEPFILYGVNLPYFTVVFMFNLAVLITVSRQIFKLKQVEKKKHKIIPVKDAGTVLGLMCLLGTSWGLVFLSSGYTNYPILYLFCISNTLQGFSIFLWMFLTARPDKQKATHTKSLSTVDTFPIEKQREIAHA